MYLIGWGVWRGGGVLVNVGVPRGDVKGGSAIVLGVAALSNEVAHSAPWVVG